MNASSSAEGRIRRRHPDGTHEELEQLAEWVAAKANNEPNRRREKRLDDAYLHLSEILDPCRCTEGRVSRRRSIAHSWSSLRDSNRQIRGKWRIDESDLWDRDALDLVGPASFEFLPDGTGSFRFIARGGWTAGRPPSMASPESSSVGTALTKATP